MKKLILLLMIAMLSGFAYSQQAATPAPAHVRFGIHKEKCMIRHERNGIRHDFRRFHRYMRFKHMRHRHRHHRQAIVRPVR